MLRFMVKSLKVSLGKVFWTKIFQFPTKTILPSKAYEVNLVRKKLCPIVRENLKVKLTDVVDKLGLWEMECWSE